MEEKNEKIFLTIILLGFIIVFYYNTFVWLIESWLGNQYYSHGFIVPVVSGFIIWNMRKELTKIEQKQSQSGLIFFVAGLVLYGIAIQLEARFISGLSLIITIFGTVLYLFGWKFTNRIKFPILFLLLAIPLPFIDLVAPPAQTISAVASASLANLVGLPVHREGLLLNMPTGTFEVALECSGLRSIVSLFTVSIIFAIMLDGGMVKKYVISLSSIPLAMAGNIIRIISVIAVANTYGQDAALNYFHDFSSLALFSVALIGLFLVGRTFGPLKFKKF